MSPRRSSRRCLGSNNDGEDNPSGSDCSASGFFAPIVAAAGDPCGSGRQRGFRFEVEEAAGLSSRAGRRGIPPQWPSLEDHQCSPAGREVWTRARKGDRRGPPGGFWVTWRAGGQGYFLRPRPSSPAGRLPCHRRVFRQDLTRSTLTERAANPRQCVQCGLSAGGTSSPGPHSR